MATVIFLLLSGLLAIVTRDYFNARGVSDYVLQSLLKQTKCRRATRTIIQPRRFVAFTNIREITNESLHHVTASHHRVIVFLVSAAMSMGHGFDNSTVVHRSEIWHRETYSSTVHDIETVLTFDVIQSLGWATDLAILREKVPSGTLRLMFCGY